MVKSKPTSKKIFNRALKILLITNSLILFSAAMIGPIYALFVEEIGGDLLSASFAGGMFALAAGIASLVSGTIADRVKEKEYIVIVGYLLIGLGFLLYIFCRSILFLLVIQVIIGLGEAIYSPAFDALFSSHTHHRERGRQWGAWESIYYFTAAAGALVGGYMVVRFGFNSIFLTMAILCFGTAIYMYFLPRKLL